MPFEIERLRPDELWDVVKARNRRDRAMEWNIAYLLRVKEPPGYQKWVDPPPPIPLAQRRAEAMQVLKEFEGVPPPKPRATAF